MGEQLRLGGSADRDSDDRRYLKKCKKKKAKARKKCKQKAKKLPV